MDPIANQTTINANGEYHFDPFPPTAEVQLEWEITGGTATVTPGYVSQSGLFAPALDTAGAAVIQGATGGIVRVFVPLSGKVALKVESASSLVMTAAAIRCLP